MPFFSSFTGSFTVGRRLPRGLGLALGIRAASFNGNSFGTNTEELNPDGITFNDNGSKMYIIGPTSDEVYEYSLETNFDVSSASYTGNKLGYNSQDTRVRDLGFNDDGTKLFLLGTFSTAGSLYQYNLTIPYDLSTASYASISKLLTGFTYGPKGFDFSPDGTVLWTINSAEIVEYSLSTAFDISTISATGETLNVFSTTTSAYDGVFTNNGNTFLLLSNGNPSADQDKVREYSMTSPYDLSTATASGDFFIGDEAAGASGIFVNDDANKLIIVDSSGADVYEYDISGSGYRGLGADFSIAKDFTSAFASLADTSNTGGLGIKVSMSADKSTMIMHRPSDGDVASFAGAIEIFKNNNDGTWSYVEKFTVPSQTPGANGGYSSSGFGDGVALSADGSKIAVSGSGHGVNGANQNCGGAIWVLERQPDGTYAEFDRIDRPYSSNPNLGKAIDISADGTYIAASGSQLTHVSNIVYKLNSGTGEYEKMNSTTDGASNGVSVNWGSSSDLARGGYQNMVAAISDDGLYTVFGNQGSYEFGIGYGYAAVGFYDGSSWSVQQELRPANTSNPFGGKYGVSVDINEDGTVCVVGSTRHYDVGNSNRVGAFYVWRRTGSTWTEEQRVLGTSTNGFLGNNVRILPDGNTIFATAQQENFQSNKKILVYTYDSGSGTWSLAETIETNYTDTNFENEDQMDVSSDGSLVVVTAYGNTGTKALFFETTGGPYYYGESAANFSSDFSISSSVALNVLGQSVAITDNYLIATRKVTDGLITDGEAVIYDSSGKRLHTILNPGDTDANGDWFGSSVDISSTYSIVGAKNENLTNTNEGIAYIFRNITGELVHTLNNPNDDLGGLIPSTTTENDRFGNAVAITDTYAVVGAEYADNYSGHTASNCGRLYVFDNSDGSLVYNLSHPTDAPVSFGTPYAVDSRLGHKVAINDTYVAASAVGWNNNTYQGRVYVWNLSDGSLAYTLDNPNNFGSSPTDYFGSSIALSDTHLVVGASNEDSADGTGSGTAYVYDLSDGSLLYSIVNPNTTGSSAGDKFGDAVGINAEKIYVGAGNEDDGFSNSGKIYVFNLSDGGLSSTIANPLSAGVNFGRNFQVKGSNMIAGHPQANSGGGAFYVYTGLEGGGGATYTVSGATQSATTQLPGGALVYLNYNADGTEVTTTYNSSKQLYTVALPTPYDPTSGVANYDSGDPNEVINITAGSLAGFRYNNDGTKAFFTHQYANSSPSLVSGHISEFPLGTAYDIFSISSSPNALYDVTGDWYGSNSFNITDINFNTDGSKMFITNGGGLSALGIFEYDLGTEFDLSTATYSQGFDFATDMPADILPRFGTFNSAGTKFYMADIREEYVYEFDLSTGFDVSTMSYNGVFLDISGIDTGLRQVGLSQDETQLYVTGAQNRRIYTFDLVQE